MNPRTRSIHPIYNFLPTEIEGFDSLAELALDMRSSWNHAADEVWRTLDPILWDLTHNPWVVLQTVSRDRIESVVGDNAFRKKVDDLLEIRRQEAEAPAWFQVDHPHAPLNYVAYFCMEFMLSEALPIYSGGLGNVAGDQLKAAADLGVPVVGVGLLYQQGYFRQMIDKNGAQQALFPYNDPGQLPITPLRRANGEWLRLEIDLPGYSVWLRAWQVQVGRVKLYLLDSNDAVNLPAHRGITSELYGGGTELRLKQELLLGIGGWRLLAELGIKPEVCHLNEGHAAFAVLERTASFMQETAQPFEVALAVTRAGNIFTTHTPVAAGFDRFEPALIEQYLSAYAASKLGISLHDLLALGRLDPNNSSELFNMAYLAVRGSGAVNGVSRLHGEVSRKIFQPLFSRWPEIEVPVRHVTNGVHMPSWDSAEADALWTKYCGKDRWLKTTECLEENIRNIPDDELWKLRADARTSLVGYVREQLSELLASRGASSGDIAGAAHVFTADTLTLGFARRFATYKRPNLLLHDPERLQRILTNAERPVQLIIAGKAHPDDHAGQAMIQEWAQFIWRPEMRRHVVFLSDYNMLVSERLVQGVDVWLNTPRRPWEACGTSGMKVLVNGGLNLSELDGWWAEAYTPEVGWALGDGKEHVDDRITDDAEAEALYTLLEREVIPEFYNRDRNGIPAAWVTRIRESMARLTCHYSSVRTVLQYTDEYYLPAAKSYNDRAANNGKKGATIVNWRNDLNRDWADLRFGEMSVVMDGDRKLFEVQVYLNGLDPEAVRIELYADGVNGSDPLCKEMTRGPSLVGAESGYLFSAEGDVIRTTAEYTVRAIPCRAGVAVPLEASHIKWQQ